MSLFHLDWFKCADGHHIEERPDHWVEVHPDNPAQGFPGLYIVPNVPPGQSLDSGHWLRTEPLDHPGLYRQLADCEPSAEGVLDFRGTLAVEKTAPVGFEQIDLRFELDTDADEEQLATLLKLTERYCVIYQTLRHAPSIGVTHRANGA